MNVDFLGTPLQIGDAVVFMEPQYRSLMNGRIRTMAGKTCLIEYVRPDGDEILVRQFYSQIIRDPRQPAP